MTISYVVAALAGALVSTGLITLGLNFRLGAYYWAEPPTAYFLAAPIGAVAANAIAYALRKTIFG